MRDILFRGQTRRKGEKVRMGDGKPIDSNWVYGGIFPQNKGGDFAIIYQQEPEIEKFTVYADTVGQYTGIDDIYDKKIFEGDIVYPTEDELFASVFEIKYLCTKDFIGFALYNNEAWVSLGNDIKLKIVGNIFDDKELLEE